MATQTQPSTTNNGFATTSLVTGIVGAALSWVPFVGFALGVLGIIFGAVSLKKGQNKSFAIAGLVTGAVAVLVAFIFLIFTVAFAAATVHTHTYYYRTY